ncbi:hypothetical protein DICVIV_06697 [Dictyocaulus viviparus]|uniref:G-protein coupled receptors family 1 profile domain-containing protein n=1 Tax=Dictyocaulus viviparus TaxID=29172 RepID=A0A0D8XRE8_DICVI|nr:hypothetical protein DICVIV_06697 [Dictyocaulus viviparus]
MAVCFILPCFIICCICYFCIHRLLHRHRNNTSISFKRQRRVFLQLTAIFVTFTMITVYHVMQFYFSYHQYNAVLRKMRLIHPLISCVLSYVSPWIMIITATDLRQKFRHIFESRKILRSIFTLKNVKKFSDVPTVNSKLYVFWTSTQSVRNIRVY